MRWAKSENLNQILLYAGCPNGLLFFAELKATGKKARPLQKFILKKLQELGFSFYVIDSMEQVKEVLQSYGI